MPEEGQSREHPKCYEYNKQVGYKKKASINDNYLSQKSSHKLFILTYVYSSV